MKTFRKAVEKADRFLKKPGMHILFGAILLAPAVFYGLYFLADDAADSLVPLQPRWSVQTTTGGGLCLTLGLLGLFYLYGGIRRLVKRAAPGGSSGGSTRT